MTSKLAGFISHEALTYIVKVRRGRKIEEALRSPDYAEAKAKASASLDEGQWVFIDVEVGRAAG